MKIILPLCTLLLTLSPVPAAEQNLVKSPAQSQRPSREDFAQVDTNRDGVVSKDEFNAGRRAKANPERAATAFTFKDTDKNDKLTKEEFAREEKSLPGKRPSPEEQFKRLDISTDSAVSREEFKASRMFKANPEGAAAAFTIKDTNKDDKLTKEEFVKQAAGEKPGQGKRPSPEEQFKSLDTSKDGTVSRDEFKAGRMFKANPEGAAAAFTVKDTDKDNKLTNEEFVKQAAGEKSGQGKRPSPEEQFKKLDTNNDASVSKEEFNTGRMAKKDPERAAKAFSLGDSNKDGKLTKEEFGKTRGPQKKL